MAGHSNLRLIWAQGEFAGTNEHYHFIDGCKVNLHGRRVDLHACIYGRKVDLHGCRVDLHAYKPSYIYTIYMGAEWICMGAN